MSLAQLKKDLRLHIDEEKAAFYPNFFRAGPGGYGEGDKFLGVTVPSIRKVARAYIDLTLEHIEKLLLSKWHEERMLALVILVNRFQKGSVEEQKEIFDFYLAHRDRVNNWDLVDISTHKIVGAYLLNRPKKDLKILKDLARSELLWDRRIAMVATWWFIRSGELDVVITLAKILLNDEHDLMHKAVGWMLREMGKKDLQLLEDFLLEGGRYKTMPRTMLRYAIEKIPETRRKKYIKGEL